MSDKDKGILELIDECASAVPDKEWDKLPKNASQIVGHEDDYIAYCPGCGDGLKTDWKQKTNEYYCIGCDEYYTLEQKKKPSSFIIEKGLRSWQLVDLESFLTRYLSKEKFKDVDYRIDLLTYNAIEPVKSRVYKKAYDTYDIDLRSKLADILMCTLVVAVSADIRLSDVVELGINKYKEREWKNKK